MIRRRRARCCPSLTERLGASLRFALPLFEGRLLLGRRFGLILGLPLGVGHAVHDLSRACLVELDAPGCGRLLVPARQAVSAEPRQLHQGDVLHVRPLTKMLDQLPKGRRLELDSGAFIQLHPPTLRPLAFRDRLPQQKNNDSNHLRPTPRQLASSAHGQAPRAHLLAKPLASELRASRPALHQKWPGAHQVIRLDTPMLRHESPSHRLCCSSKHFTCNVTTGQETAT